MAETVRAAKESSVNQEIRIQDMSLHCLVVPRVVRSLAQEHTAINK